MPDGGSVVTRRRPDRGVASDPGLRRSSRGVDPPEVTMCNFELDPQAFTQRRVEMIALAQERRLAVALKPARDRRERARRKARVPVLGPARLKPSLVPR